jgi:hypothetical protein
MWRIKNAAYFFAGYAGAFVIVLMIVIAALAIAYWLVYGVVFKLGLPISEERVWHICLVSAVCYVAIMAKIKPN